MTTAAPLQDFIRSIPASGPFEILDTLNIMKPTDRDLFLEEIADEKNQITVGHLMYWLKYLEKYEKEMAEQIEEIAISRHREYKEHAGADALPYALARFSPEEQKIIAGNILAVQATSGCGGGCDFCGLDAVLGVRDRIPSKQLTNLLDLAYDQGIFEPFLYWASDSLEVFDNLADFCQLLQNWKFKSGPHFRTIVPVGTKDIYAGLCELDSGVSVTLSRMNIERLKRVGITKVGSMREVYDIFVRYSSTTNILSPLRSNDELLNDLFNADFVPESVLLLFDNDIMNVGINHYFTPVRTFSICDSGSIITPYTVVNSARSLSANRKYPQGTMLFQLIDCLTSL